MLSNNAIFRSTVSGGRDVCSFGKHGTFRNFTVFFPFFANISISLCNLNLSKTSFLWSWNYILSFPVSLYKALAFFEIIEMRKSWKLIRFGCFADPKPRNETLAKYSFRIFRDIKHARKWVRCSGSLLVYYHENHPMFSCELRKWTQGCTKEAIFEKQQKTTIYSPTYEQTKVRFFELLLI